MTPLETKLRRLVGALDIPALEALSSKGLLRRAQKDIERAVKISVLGDSAASLQLKVAEFEVAIPETGPALATCSCSSTGVCQHILSAVLFLQQGSKANESDQP